MNKGASYSAPSELPLWLIILNLRTFDIVEGLPRMEI